MPILKYVNHKCKQHPCIHHSIFIICLCTWVSRVYVSQHNCLLCTPNRKLVLLHYWNSNNLIWHCKKSTRQDYTDWISSLQQTRNTSTGHYPSPLLLRKWPVGWWCLWCPLHRRPTCPTAPATPRPVEDVSLCTHVHTKQEHESLLGKRFVASPARTCIETFYGRSERA